MVEIGVGPGIRTCNYVMNMRHIVDVVHVADNQFDYGIVGVIVGVIVKAPPTTYGS